MKKRNLVSEVMPSLKEERSGKAKVAFSLAEGATHVEKSNGKRKCAFTLAEVLITLGIIGVVAAITIPMLNTKISSKVREHQIEVFEKKLNQGTELMQANGSLSVTYNSTTDFVNNLAKEMIITSVCDKDNLTNCWGYSNVKTNKGNGTYSISKAKKGSAFAVFDGDYGETVGIITGDGTPMILSYNKDCELMDSESRYQEGSTSGCIIGVYDLNGASGPNEFGKDVIGFNGATLGCVFELDGTCYLTTPFKPKNALSNDECVKNKDKWGISACRDDDNDWWGAGVKACGGTQNMPSTSDLTNLAKKLYNDENITNDQNKTGLTIADPNSDIAKFISPGIPGQTTKALWANRLWVSNPYFRHFISNQTIGGVAPAYGPYRNENQPYTVCISK